MKTIKLKPTDFYFFRKTAFALGMSFICSISNNVYTVKADSSQLKELGY